MFLRHLFSEKKVFMLIGGLILASVLTGSVCCGLCCGEKELYNYLSEFIKNAGNLNKLNISLGNLEELLFVFFVIFFSAFFRLGMLINMYAVCRRSFVMGYTVTAFFKAFGVRGMLPLCGILPEMVILTTALIAFSGCAVKMSVSKFEKKDKIFFVFLGLFFCTIFCGLSFFNGYITTTFMKILSYKFA